jgi:hypothetical protein
MEEKQRAREEEKLRVLEEMKGAREEEKQRAREERKGAVRFSSLRLLSRI